MATDNTAGDTWAQWVNDQFDDPEHRHLRQLDLAQAVGVGNSAISKWRRGAHPADADAAVRAAKFFRRPPYEALRAAGHHELADLIDPATTGIPAPEPVDPIADEIMSWTHLDLKVRRALLEEYRADLDAALQAARRRVRATVEMLDTRKDSA